MIKLFVCLVVDWSLVIVHIVSDYIQSVLVYNLAFCFLIKSPHMPHLHESGLEGLRLSTKPVFS